MNDITQPLRLAVGSHEAGSGMGCAMNVVSWENGDVEITDYPECAHPGLATMVQRVNDHCCDHRGDQTLCPSCSVLVLALAHRTVGTATGRPLPDTTMHLRPSPTRAGCGRWGCCRRCSPGTRPSPRGRGQRCTSEWSGRRLPAITTANRGHA